MPLDGAEMSPENRMIGSKGWKDLTAEQNIAAPLSNLR